MKFELKIFNYAFRAFAIVFFAIVLAACQSTLFTYRGSTAKETLHIVLKPDAQQAGTWYSHDLNVYYSYHKHDKTLQIVGNVEFASRYNNYKTKYFFLELHFLDDENKIRHFYMVFNHFNDYLKPWL